MTQKIHLCARIATATALLLSVGCSSNDTSVYSQQESVLTEHDIAEQALDNQTIGRSKIAQNQPRVLATNKPMPTNEISVSDSRLSSVQSTQTTNHPRALSQSPTNRESAGIHKSIEPGWALPRNTNSEKYQTISSNPVVRVVDQSTSTFSIDVDTGSYSNMRRLLNAGQLPPKDAVRLEELLNYFEYSYDTPNIDEQPFSISTELASTPWNEKTRLLHIGLQGYEIDPAQRPAANLVFLIDVSGSMSAPNKLGLLKSSIKMLTKDLNENDTVSMVVYAGASGVVLEPTPGDNTRKINLALDQLQARGSTNGQAGIELAYSLAEQQMSDNSINRIILATDGDFNVGISNIETLKDLIKHKRKSGIALTTLGFGSGNYNDHLMEQLADVGNGNYAYIDTLNEARKVLGQQMSATLMTIAKDVKIQVEFNPAQVSEYRLLGYINRKLANEDFANDTVDAGEIGAGHSVTALYEIALTDEGGERHSPSRYSNATNENDTLDSLTMDKPDSRLHEIAQIRLRYKKPDQDSSQLLSQIVYRSQLVNSISDSSDNFRFSAAVAGFAQLLRGGNYTNEFSYDRAAQLANAAKGDDRYGYRGEFIQLVELANALDQQNQVQLH